MCLLQPHYHGNQQTRCLAGQRKRSPVLLPLLFVYMAVSGLTRSLRVVGDQAQLARAIRRSGSWHRDRSALPAVSCALVGDVADIVGVETLGSTALIVHGLPGSNTRRQEAVDLGV